MNSKGLILILLTLYLISCVSDGSHFKFTVEPEKDGITGGGTIRFTFRDDAGMEIEQREIDFVPTRQYRVGIPDGAVFFDYYLSKEIKRILGNKNKPIWFSGSYMLISITDGRHDFTFYANDPVEMLAPQHGSVFSTPEQIVIRWEEEKRADRYLVDVRTSGSTDSGKMIRAILPSSYLSINLESLIELLNQNYDFQYALKNNLPFAEGDFQGSQDGQLEITVEGMTIGPDGQLWQLTTSQGGQEITVELKGM